MSGDVHVERRQNCKGSRARHIQVVRTNGARRGGSRAGQPVSKVVVKTERAVYRLRRAQAARLLRRNQVVLVDRPALRHVIRLHMFLGGRLAWCTEGWKTIRTCCRAISAGFALRVRVPRLWSRRRASAHRHGSVEVLVDRGVDSFQWSRVQPLGLRGSGRHLVRWRHADPFPRADSPPGGAQRRRRRCHDNRLRHAGGWLQLIILTKKEILQHLQRCLAPGVR